MSPTHYNVIHDFSGWNLDRHQMLAYKLCHLYYNWAGAIRVPGGESHAAAAVDAAATVALSLQGLMPVRWLMPVHGFGLIHLR